MGANKSKADHFDNWSVLMKYKGFNIKAYYSLCSDWKLDKNDRVVECEPTSQDIQWYDIFDPMCNGERWVSCDTIEECKVFIDSYLLKVNMKDNTLASWNKIGD